MPFDEGVFINNKLNIAIIYYVDDFIFLRPYNKEIENIISLLSKDIKV